MSEHWSCCSSDVMLVTEFTDCLMAVKPTHKTETRTGLSQSDDGGQILGMKGGIIG